MNWRKYFLILAGIVFCCGDRVCTGAGVPPLHISDLADDSDVVVVAEEGKLKLVSSTQIDIGGYMVAAQRYQVQAVARYFLKGSCPENFNFEFVFPETSSGYRALKPGIRLLFLKKLDDTYVPTSPYYPDLPAVSSNPILAKSGTVTESVFAVLAAVVASPEATASDKLEVLARSYAIPRSDKSYLTQLHAGLQSTSDPDLKRRIQAELLARDDVSEFSEVCNALLADTLSRNQKDIILYVIGERLKTEKAVPELIALLNSSDPEVRVASAQALWHISSHSSLGALAKAVSDQNSEVQYYAIRGLADITGQLEWGPSPGEFQEHSEKYRQHWLEWAIQNRAVSKNE